jgi:hypothetical protein
VYTTAIEQYMQLGHAEEVNTSLPDSDRAFVLPHHAVFRETAVTTKARIVFDGSATDVTGYSVNDALLPGPALQPCLMEILLLFRRFQIAFAGDIEKMFLQIQVD